MSPPLQIFISYSHDSDEHANRVRELADRLRGDGIDCALDQYVTAPPEGWPRWMQNCVEKADFVLVVATAIYKQRAGGKERSGVGRGVNFESILIVQDLYEAGMWNERFVPVLLKGARPEDIITPLKPYTYHVVITDQGYESLYRHLTGQPKVTKPLIGKERILLPAADQRSPASVSKDKGGLEEDEVSEIEGDAIGAAKDPPSPRRQGRLALMAAIVAIVGGIVAGVTGILDIPAKWRQMRQDPVIVGEEHPTHLLRIQILDGLKPLPGVTVQLPEHDLRAITNDLGTVSFQIPGADPSWVKIRALAPGYADLNEDVMAGSEQLNPFPMRRIE
ncbi:MAG: TIR domain-containing protein [Deltaproteobacteria bacterium]|nr:TIR domain-containing protein [Deltaproteobacteria bacterium]